MKPRILTRAWRSGATMALTVMACTAGAAAPSPVTSAPAARPAQELRVATVGFALASRNVAQCPGALAPQSGLVLFTAARQDEADPTARLIGVVPGSPADRAGLRGDDALLAVNGQTLPAEAVPRKPGGPNAWDRARAMLDEHMAKGEITVRYRRLGAVAEAKIQPVAGCLSHFEVLAGGKVNAWADGRRIVVGEALIAASRTDDALAFVIAHELAHNVLRAAGSGLRSREAELAADRLGLTLLREAGFDAPRALAAWRPYIYRAGSSRTHPGAETRVAALAAGVAQNR